jgi:hypothetical protein
VCKPRAFREDDHDLGKIVLELVVAVALGGGAACDIAVLREQPGVFRPVVFRLVAALLLQL